MKIFTKLVLVLGGVLLIAQTAIAAGDLGTQFPTPQSGIIDTRHNMTQSSLPGGGGTMFAYRNNYGEVCVYCHTPHGANSAAAPLWNRKFPSTTYQTYDTLNTSSLTQKVFLPGAASLPCLSCHDGSQAIDAIINMPGSGQYSAAADPTTWTPNSTGQSKGGSHMNLSATGCLACHAPGTGPVGGAATDFTVFVIGADLRNDHPVGVNYPTTNGGTTDWKTPAGTVTRGAVVTTFFDENANGRMDKGDIRLYGSDTDSRVECASCHDPHGVAPGGVGTAMLPTFLRKTNTGSTVCLTCHNK